MPISCCLSSRHNNSNYKEFGSFIPLISKESGIKSKVDNFLWRQSIVFNPSHDYSVHFLTTDFVRDLQNELLDAPLLIKMEKNEHTPEKTNVNATKCQTSSFSPVILPQSPAATSPQKNLTGLPRVARDIVADVYNNIQIWNDCHIRGAQIVKQIAILKSDDPKHYSLQLEEYTNDLYNIVQSLMTLKNKFENFKSQIRALGKLKKDSEPLFISLDANSLIHLVETIANAYMEEFKNKEVVLENIAHSKNKDEAMFFAASWTLQPYITSTVNLKLEVLLVETGHRNFN